MCCRRSSSQTRQCLGSRPTSTTHNRQCSERSRAPTSETYPAIPGRTPNMVGSQSVTAFTVDPDLPWLGDQGHLCNESAGTPVEPVYRRGGGPLAGRMRRFAGVWAALTVGRTSTCPPIRATLRRTPSSERCRRLRSARARRLSMAKPPITGQGPPTRIVTKAQAIIDVSGDTVSSRDRPKST